METDVTESNHNDESETDAMLDRFVVHIMPVLCSIGPGLSFEPPLFTKLIRICQAFLAEKKFASQQQSSNGGESVNGDNLKEQTPPPGASSASAAQQSLPQLAPSQVVKQMNKKELAFFNQIYTLLNEIFLPSLSMLNMNPCLAIEVWNLLKLFPYEMRFVFFLLCIILIGDVRIFVSYSIKRKRKKNINFLIFFSIFLIK